MNDDEPGHDGPDHQYEFQPLWDDAEEHECVKPGKYKLVSVSNGALRAQGRGRPVITRNTKDFPGFTPIRSPALHQRRVLIWSSTCSSSSLALPDEA